MVGFAIFGGLVALLLALIGLGVVITGLLKVLDP